MSLSFSLTNANTSLDWIHYNQKGYIWIWKIRLMKRNFLLPKIGFWAGKIQGQNFECLLVWIRFLVVRLVETRSPRRSEVSHPQRQIWWDKLSSGGNWKTHYRRAMVVPRHCGYIRLSLDATTGLKYLHNFHRNDILGHALEFCGAVSFLTIIQTKNKMSQLLMWAKSRNSICLLRNLCFHGLTSRKWRAYNQYPMRRQYGNEGQISSEIPFRYLCPFEVVHFHHPPPQSTDQILFRIVSPS